MCHLNITVEIISARSVCDHLLIIITIKDLVHVQFYYLKFLCKAYLIQIFSFSLFSTAKECAVFDQSRTKTVFFHM